MATNVKIWMIIWLPLLCACTNNAPEISVVAEENAVGNSIIKWEVTPMIEGNLKVYASTDPDLIPEENPVAVAPIADNKLTVISPNPHQRYYYKLVFNDRYSQKSANRNINITGIQNFRDLGGYPSTLKHKKVRWGKIYRSGKIDSLSCYSLQELRNLGIRTIIDLRSVEEQRRAPQLQANDFRKVNIPISYEKMDEVIEKIQHGVIHGDTIRSIIEHINQDLALQFLEEYRTLIQTLLEPDNYPIVLHGATGRNRTGIVSAIILSILGVDQETILEDYQLSNKYFNVCDESKYAYNLPIYSQEAITLAFSSKRSFLEAARSKIEDNFGSLDAYMIEGLELTQKDINKIRSILLE